MSMAAADASRANSRSGRVTVCTGSRVANRATQNNDRGVADFDSLTDNIAARAATNVIANRMDEVRTYTGDTAN